MVSAYCAMEDMVFGQCLEGTTCAMEDVLGELGLAMYNNLFGENKTEINVFVVR